jgi:hypothetical protein
MRRTRNYFTSVNDYVLAVTLSSTSFVVEPPLLGSLLRSEVGVDKYIFEKWIYTPAKIFSYFNNISAD